MSDLREKPDLDTDIMAIRALLDENGPARARADESDMSVEDAAPGAEDRPAPAPRQHAAPTDEEPELGARIRAAEQAAETMTPAPDRTAQPGFGARLGALRSRLAGRVRGYRPTPRHVAFAVIVLLAVLRPWLLLALLLLPVVIVAGLFLAVGYDRFWAGVLRLYKRYHARRPQRAERLRRKADAFALRWDAFLDRFPEGSVDALYLPDLNSLQQQEARHEQALDQRFSKLQDEARAN